jgi:hypothetical protein
LFSSNIFHSIPFHGIFSPLLVREHTERRINCLRDLKQLIRTRMVKIVVKCDTEFCRRFAVKCREDRGLRRLCRRKGWSGLTHLWGCLSL